MAGPRSGPAVGGRGATAGRPPLLAAGLLVCGNLFNVVALYPITHVDCFAVVTGRTVRLVDVTGWLWLHMAIGTAVAAAGFAVFLDRRGATPIGIGFAALAAVVGIVFFPYTPARSALIVGVNIAAVRLLVRHRYAARR